MKSFHSRRFFTGSVRGRGAAAVRLWCLVSIAPGSAAAQGLISPGETERAFTPSWWLVGLVILSVSLLIWAVSRYRLATARRRELELTSLVDQRTREIRSLGSLTDKINLAVSLDDVLEHVWNSFRAVVPYNRIGFAEFDTDDRMVRAVWARSDSSDVRIGSGYSAEIDTTSLGEILATGTPRIINDLESYLEARPTSEATRAVVDEGMRSSMTVPLKAMDRDVGFLFFSSQSPNTYTDEHTRLLQRISGQLSLAIEKSRLYDSLLETTQRLEEANRQLARLAATDGLTQLANRRIFDERLETEWRRCRRNRQPLSVLMIDIDHFKNFNDIHGHIAGDECLRLVAGSLRETFTRAADLVARYGGEEFGAILPETDDERAAYLAEEVRRRIEELSNARGTCASGITVSIGVATAVPGREGAAAALLHDADTSLYVAKREGRNLVRSSGAIHVPDGVLSPAD
ncbi:MAG: diguanylate cyclase [Thermoanaerobaculales bacterium]|jgi:diguanylate cyclase (GGDEF)-like protein|nr:diguanylate cyclase [Thermoanaerobaculales bacterium]